ncbi:uncharacterized protein LOC111627901 [Centruroides sculpturatus]|uniref:uncharacterized protein LOC111627901 n=1 Tax=Centruroides sculpturatus TaxID=218467 RepID=UPI000C6DCBCE|nr:uncharacterized protein LOC111627901 [Centruroides sculpturatus]
MMKNETETIEQHFYNFLKVNGGNEDIESSKGFLRLHFPKEHAQLHTLNELIQLIINNNMPMIESIELIKCVVKTYLNNSELGNFISDYEYLMKNIGTEDTITVYHLYKKIADFIENKIGSSNVQNLKNDFKHIIDSERVFDTIDTFSQLFGILEDRDALNDNDVSPLEHILNKLDRNDDIDTIKRVLNVFIKLSHMQYKCKICKCQTNFKPFRIPNEDFEAPKPAETLVPKESDELQAVINYLCKNLGPDWKKLARALRIPESRIQSIVHDHIRQVEEQAYQMMMLWRTTNENPTVDKLLTALKSPICEKMSLVRDIKTGKHLQF